MDSHRDFVRSLSGEERQRLVIRQVLYDGSWEELENDLSARRSGKPYVFKLQTRIDEDLERISKLKNYERDHDVNLDQYVASASLEGDFGSEESDE